jgi:hypothetical protein
MAEGYSRIGGVLWLAGRPRLFISRRIRRGPLWAGRKLKGLVGCKQTLETFRVIEATGPKLELRVLAQGHASLLHGAPVWGQVVEQLPRFSE